MSSIKSISGYDLAKTLFHKCGGRNIDAMVDFAGGETDWLEFKAGLFARMEDLEDGETQEDMLWHVARAVFGFLNSAGGLLVLGIRQDGPQFKVDDLKKSPHGDVLADKGGEEFLRTVVEPNLPPGKKVWNTASKGQWIWKGKNPNILKDSIEIRMARYKGRDVVLGFVKPLPKGERQLVWHGREADASLPARRRSRGGAVHP